MALGESHHPCDRRPPPHSLCAGSCRRPVQTLPLPLAGPPAAQAPLRAWSPWARPPQAALCVPLGDAAFAGGGKRSWVWPPLLHARASASSGLFHVKRWLRLCTSLCSLGEILSSGRAESAPCLTFRELPGWSPKRLSWLHWQPPCSRQHCCARPPVSPLLVGALEPRCSCPS